MDRILAPDLLGLHSADPREGTQAVGEGENGRTGARETRDGHGARFDLDALGPHVARLGEGGEKRFQQLQVLRRGIEPGTEAADGGLQRVEVRDLALHGGPAPFQAALLLRTDDKS